MFPECPGNLRGINNLHCSERRQTSEHHEQRCAGVEEPWTIERVAKFIDLLLRKMLASPLCMHSREECESSRMPIAPEKPAALFEERGASATSTQADLRKSLMSSSSQEPNTPRKAAALFSSGSEEKEIQFKSSVFKNTDPSNLGRSFLEGKKFHLLSHARSETMKQEHQVESLKNCISDLSATRFKLIVRDWNYRTLNTDILNLDENKFVYK